MVNLGKFQAASRLKKAVGKAMANRLNFQLTKTIITCKYICLCRITDKEREHMKEIFEKYDTNKDGRLDADELVTMMKELGSHGEALAGALKVMDENGWAKDAFKPDFL